MNVLRLRVCVIVSGPVGNPDSSSVHRRSPKSKFLAGLVPVDSSLVTTLFTLLPKGRDMSGTTTSYPSVIELEAAIASEREEDPVVTQTRRDCDQAKSGQK